jgi:hypothetical protein
MESETFHLAGWHPNSFIGWDDMGETWFAQMWRPHEDHRTDPPAVWISGVPRPYQHPLDIIDAVAVRAGVHPDDVIEALMVAIPDDRPYDAWTMLQKYLASRVASEENPAEVARWAQHPRGWVRMEAVNNPYRTVGLPPPPTEHARFLPPPPAPDSTGLFGLRRRTSR